jgi:hypothetical protein
MNMIGGLLDQLIGMRIQVDTVHTFYVRSWDNMPEVADNRVDDKHLAVLIEIESPRIGHSVHHIFDGAMDGMVSPDTGIDLDALRVARAWFADIAGRLNPVSSVEPTIGSPFETVGWRVTNDPFIESIEHDDRRTVGNVIPVSVGKEKKIWQADSPNPSVAHFNAGQFASIVPKDSSLIVFSIAILIFKNDNAIPLISVEATRSTTCPTIVLCHPKATSFIGGNRNRILDVGFGCKDR